MQGGDISNESPGSILVNLDVVLIPSISVGRVLGIFPTTAHDFEIDALTANAISRVAEQSSFTWEAFAVGMAERSVNRLLDELEHAGIQPFRWVIHVDSVEDLMSQLPYRRGVLGIVDRPQRALMYGSLYVDLGLIDGR